MLRRAECRDILGVPVAVCRDEPKLAEVFARLTAAFELLQNHSEGTLRDIRRHTDGVFIFGTAGALGPWRREERLVILEETHVRDEGTAAADIASTLVHESTHARLDAKGFAYTPELRERIEKVCFRRELGFARRLVEPGDLVDRAQRQLERPPDYLTTDAFRLRIREKLIELGVPAWLVRVVEWLRDRADSLRAVRLG